MQKLRTIAEGSVDPLYFYSKDSSRNKAGDLDRRGVL